MKVKTLRNCLSKRARAMAGAYARALALAIVLLAVPLAQAAMAAGAAMAAVAGPLVCVIVPHFKDEYWLSVGFGLEQAAQAEGAALMIHESGGYNSIDRQVALLDACLAAGSDAILIGAVSADDPRLVAAVQAASARLPVLALVNELDAAGLAGWIGVDWRGMGRAVARHLTRRAETEGPQKVVVITGPGESGWGPILDQGLAEGLSGSAVEIVATYRADTGLREQLREVERALAAHPDIDVMVGSAPAIEGAMALLRRLPADAARPRLVATYISHSVLRGLRNGQVDMVPFDDPIAQGRLGVQLALEAIGGARFPGLSGPEILPVVRGTARVAQIRLSPSGYFPELQ